MRLIETARMAMARGRHEAGCDPVSCDFTVARVRVYLICWEQAERFSEPFADVYGAVRSSRRVDQWTSGTRRDGLRAVDIGVALQQARDNGGLTLRSWNADAVAAWLCGNLHQEPTIDSTDFEALR